MKLLQDKRILCIYIITIILIIVGIAYAYQVSGLDTSQTTAYLNIDEAAYGPNTFDSTNIDLIPILDKDIENTDNNNVIKIEFNVGGAKENKRKNIVYDIALVDLLLNCELLSPYVKWKLIKNNDETYEGSFDYKFDTIKNGRLVLTTIQQDLKEYSEDKSTYDHYVFYLWLSNSCQEEDLTQCSIPVEDQSNLLNKKLSGKIEVELYGERKSKLIRQASEILDESTCLIEDGDENASN